mgnify:CR=1 FL=1|tara:strand:- start:34 stop:717 length:684 start_codon:yes stop_codon:yes gene_type:complete
MANLAELMAYNMPKSAPNPLANALAQGEIKPSLKQRLRESADLASREEAREEFKENDFRWMETLKGDDIKTRKDKSKPVVYINYDKWENKLPDDRLKNGKLPPELVDKYFLAETMHNLEGVDPEMYQKLWDAATGSEAYMDWAANSYKHVTTGRENPTMYGMRGRPIEKRPFDEWLKRSRFDQTLGGYLYAGDPDFPTLRDWKRAWYSESPEFMRLLNELATQLEIQ